MCWPKLKTEVKRFQLTAARRRLGLRIIRAFPSGNFNSQPREGGWQSQIDTVEMSPISTHSRAKAAGSI